MYEYQTQRRELVRLLAKVPDVPEPLPEVEPDISRPPSRSAVMHLISTPETIRNGEVSALAVAETLAAMAVTVLIAVEFGTLKHITVSACLAPFSLLQTEKSRRLALDWGNKIAMRIIHIGDRVNYNRIKSNSMIDTFISRLGSAPQRAIQQFSARFGIYYATARYNRSTALILIFLAAITAMLFFEIIKLTILVSLCVLLIILKAAVLNLIIMPFTIIMAFVFFIIRTASLVVSFVVNPLLILMEIPRNWRRITLCTDLVHLPQVLPEVELEELGTGLKFFELKRFLRKALEDLG